MESKSYVKKAPDSPLPPTPSPFGEVKYSPEEVENWNNARVLGWLGENGFDKFKDFFIEHDITGDVLLELNYTYLKDMGIHLVGDRARILQAVKKQLKPQKITAINSNLESLQKLEALQISPTMPLKKRKDSLRDSPSLKSADFESTSPLGEYSAQSSGMSSYSSPNLYKLSSMKEVDYDGVRTKVNESVNPFAVPNINTDMLLSPPSVTRLRTPTNPKISPRSSSMKVIEGGSASSTSTNPPTMSLPLPPETMPSIQDSNPLSPGREVYRQLFGDSEKIKSPPIVKTRIIRVQNVSGEWSNVNIMGLVDGKSIREKMITSVTLAQDDLSSSDDYIVFHKEITSTGSLISQPDDLEILRICLDTDADQVQFLIRKRIPGNEMIINKNPLAKLEQRKESLHDEKKSEKKLQNFFGESHVPTKNTPSLLGSSSRMNSSSSLGQKKSSKLSKFFGERPPDDLIFDQLDTFFPGISRNLLEPTDESARSSNIREKVQSAILNKRMSRANYRESFSKRRSMRNSLENSSINSSSSKQMSRISETYPSILDAYTDLETKDSGDSTIRWQKGALIGQGGYGKVYHALNLDTGEIMAVKQVILGPESKIKSKKEDALKREIDLLKELKHENIVRYLGTEQTETSFNVFLEYVSGGSISSCIQKWGKFDEWLARSISCQLLYGLEYLHSQNVIHRDIKGANILIDSEGIAKISDFGISKKNEYQAAYQRVTRMSMQGSINWMAAEVAKGKGYSAKVDIWSLGCLVLEMLSGHAPWHKVQGNIIYLLGTGNAPPIPDDIGALAKDFVSNCFIIDPEKRPTATELLLHEWVQVDAYSIDFQKWVSEAATRARNNLDDEEEEEDEEEQDVSTLETTDGNTFK